MQLDNVYWCDDCGVEYPRRVLHDYDDESILTPTDKNWIADDVVGIICNICILKRKVKLFHWKRSKKNYGNDFIEKQRRK